MHNMMKVLGQNFLDKAQRFDQRVQIVMTMRRRRSITSEHTGNDWAIPENFACMNLRSPEIDTVVRFMNSGNILKKWKDDCRPGNDPRRLLRFQLFRGSLSRRTPS